jgi:hypothetical protein
LASSKSWEIIWFGGISGRKGHMSHQIANL